MILLRKGGELAVFITPGFGASYCVKRDRVMWKILCPFLLTFRSALFSKQIVLGFHAIFNVKFMLLRRLLRSCYTSHTMPVSHYKPLTESDVNKILGEPIDPAFSFPSFPSISTCFIASRKLPAIVIRLTGLTFFPSFTYQP